MATIKLQGDSIYYEFDPEIKENILGKGGMGIVFRGKLIHDDTGKFELVAIKVLFKDLSQDSIRRARREASIQVIHENIVRMYGFVETVDSDGEPKYHVISEYLDGETLDKLIKKSGILAQSEAIKIVKNILSALYMLHSRGYIHRDIDPSNIMICSDGKIKLIDFGIAKQILEYHDEFKQGTQEGKFIGKINYASPEQAEGKHWTTNATSDIYSTGILLFELLTGRLPFMGTTFEVIQGHREQPIPINESLTPDLQYVITKATAKEQKDRYQSAAEFIVDLEKIEKGVSVIPKPAPKRWLAIVSIASCVVLIIVGLSVYLVTDKNKKLEEAQRKLDVGQYSQSLELFEKANQFLSSDQAESNIKMLEVLVRAIDQYNGSHYGQADSLFRIAGELNSSDAYYYLGEMSYEGLGTPKNFKQGFEHTSKAAQMGNRLAQYRLGLVYHYGTGVEADKTKASTYFENSGKMIDQGVDNKNPELLFIKGSMYMNGNYVQQNRQRALEYYTEASELGYPQAQYELYKILKATDHQRAAEWLRKSAEQGYPKAEYEMAIIAEGNKEYSKALEWMLKAARKNYSPAFQRLGAYYSTINADYAKSFGIQINDATSHEYSRRALEYDFENFVAMHDLWFDYSKGRGVQKDLSKAEMYKKRAEEKLNELPFKEINKTREYTSPDAQSVWNALQKP